MHNGHAPGRGNVGDFDDGGCGRISDKLSGGLGAWADGDVFAVEGVGVGFGLDGDLGVVGSEHLGISKDDDGVLAGNLDVITNGLSHQL